MSKRSPRKTPSREERYMGLAFWIASFSKDPDTQVGAVIVSTDNIPLGYGYNGPARGIRDTDIDWSRPEKYDYVIHAEENALDHCVWNPRNATMYVTGIPCKRCMNRIAQKGIGKVVYFPYRSKDDGSFFSSKDEMEKTKDIARKATPVVTLTEFSGNINWMRDRMLHMENLGIFHAIS